MGEEDSQPPLRFSNERKLRKQMRKRGITDEMIRRALQAPAEPWYGKLGSAWRHRDPETQIVVLIDASTNEIFHVGTARFRYDDH